MSAVGAIGCSVPFMFPNPLNAWPVVLWDPPMGQMYVVHPTTPGTADIIRLVMSTLNFAAHLLYITYTSTYQSHQTAFELQYAHRAGKNSPVLGSNPDSTTSRYSSSCPPHPGTTSPNSFA